MTHEDAQRGTRISDAKRIHIRLNRKHYEELQMLAELEGRTVSDIIRHVIYCHLRDQAVIKEHHD